MSNVICFATARASVEVRYLFKAEIARAARAQAALAKQVGGELRGFSAWVAEHDARKSIAQPIVTDARKRA